MKIIVLLRQVVDIVEELEIAPEGISLDYDAVRYIINEGDDHALEEGLLLKEKYSGNVTAVTLAGDGADEILYTAFAKGANRIVKIEGEWKGIHSADAARIFASFIKSEKEGISPDTIILTGSQANDDIQGDMATYLSEFLGLPSLNVITGINLVSGNTKVEVIKEFAGGLRGKYELPLPCVLGIQAAEKPPRYVPVAKVRAASKSAKIETFSSPKKLQLTKIQIKKMFKPVSKGKAEMIEGTPDEVAAKLVEILRGKGLLKK